MSRKMAHTRIIQNAIPVRNDPRVKVNPCEPARVPQMPLDILYQIAKALPQPKQVLNLALASKDTWEYLQPALFECEVTYEARFAHKYGGESSTSLEQHYGNYEPRTPTGSSVEDGSWGYYDSGNDSIQHEDDYVQSDSQDGSDSEDDVQSDDDQHGYNWGGHIQSEDGGQSEWGFATESLRSRPHGRSLCPGDDECDECDGRISLQNKTFEALIPKTDDPIHIDGAMTALHWAAKQGALALPVAQKAIRAALAHQPSYINGVDLQERHLLDPVDDNFTRHIPADLPPPLFLAIAHGNFEVFKALVDAGCAVNLLQGQSVCGERYDYKSSQDPIMSFKIHEKCLYVPNMVDPCICEWKSYYLDDDGNEDEQRICQTAGHIAVRYEQTEMLKVLLQRGLNVQPPQPKSLHLTQFAVREGNLAALKILLDHDPSISHSHPRHGTLLHSVRFVGRKAERGVRDVLMTTIVQYLLEHGALLEGRTDEWDEDESDDLRGVADWERGGLTALQAALVSLEDTRKYDNRYLAAIQAAEIFIRMGADWNQRVDPNQFVNPNWDRSDLILHSCLEDAVGKRNVEWWGESDAYTAKCDEDIRMASGRTLKAIVDNEGESLTNGTSKKKAAVETASSSMFAYLVNQYSREDATGWSVECCPLAARRVGRLCLSTGITPSDEDLKKWRMFCSGEDLRG